MRGQEPRPTRRTRRPASRDTTRRTSPRRTETSDEIIEDIIIECSSSDDELDEVVDASAPKVTK